MTSDGGKKAKRSKEFTYPSSLVTGALCAVGISVSNCVGSSAIAGWKIFRKTTDSFVLVSNHPTYLDPLWVSIPVHRNLRFMAWDHAFEWPIVGKLIRYLGAFPVKTDRTVSKGAIVESLRTLEDRRRACDLSGGRARVCRRRVFGIQARRASYSDERRAYRSCPCRSAEAAAFWPQGQKFPRLFQASHRDVSSGPKLAGACPPGADLDEHLEKLNQDLIKTIRSARLGLIWRCWRLWVNSPLRCSIKRRRRASSDSRVATGGIRLNCSRVTPGNTSPLAMGGMLCAEHACRLDRRLA